MAGLLTNWVPASKRADSFKSPSRQESTDSSAARVPEVSMSNPGGYDAYMLTEAVENVLGRLDVSLEEAELLRSLLVSDVAGPVSSMFHQSRLVQSRKAAAVVQPEVTIKYRLKEKETAEISRYAREYKIKFLNRDKHDHASAAAMRIIDHKLIASRVPAGAEVTDIGGNPLHHIKCANGNVHICGSLIDKKDLSRSTLRRKAAQQIARKGEGVSQRLANEYLNRDPRFVCGKKAQECSHPSNVLTSVHVYDIPIDDWPDIMRQKSASVVEGCLLYSPSVLFQEKGEFSSVGARFEVNAKADKFYMGFINSSSWWYEHSYSDYLRYGTDQILYSGRVAYSYKIVERRGDTVFFRITSLGSIERVAPVNRAVVKMPSAPMVRVQGFDLDWDPRGEGLRKREYHFPRNLWFELVSQAAEDYERRALDYHRMYNHYRTMSVKSTINSVVVSGGERVNADELRPLIVHACLAATASSILGQRETRSLTEYAANVRRDASSSLSDAIRRAVKAMIAAGIRVVGSPLALALDALTARSADELLEFVTYWEPQVTLVDLEVLPIRCEADSGGTEPLSAREMLRQKAAMSAPYWTSDSPEVGDKVRTLGEILLGKRSPEEVKTVFQRDSGLGTSVDDADGVNKLRLASIQEHIEEIEMHNNALQANATKAYQRVFACGRPSKSQLTALAEIFANPDMWFVESGIVQRSILGRDAKAFSYSAVYHPDFRDSAGTNFAKISRTCYKGPDSNNEPVERVYFSLPTVFTGWVLTTDDMTIFNGPDILNTMRRALTCKHDYSVNLEKGPPGCGKTYSILQTFNPDEDAIMCPVRESILDTRGRAVEMYGKDFDAKARIRTLDSFLANYNEDATHDQAIERLLVDECFMAHSGKIYACAGLLGVGTVVVYGDEKQIPHIPRVQAAKDFVKVVSQSSCDVWTTRRCPPTAVAAWGSVYNWRVRSLSDKRGTISMIHSYQGLEVPDGCVMMCMYQADKLTLKKIYSRDLARIKILTAHESEGKTYEHVRLHRFDVRKRSDKSNLFDQEPHVLVAMSRHTDSFTYYCPTDLDDLVSRWIKRASDLSRVCAASDVETAGDSKQFV